MPPDRPLAALVDALRAIADGADGLTLTPGEATSLLGALPDRHSKNAVVEFTRPEVEALAWAVWFSYPAARLAYEAPLRAIDERLLSLRRQLLQG